MAVVQRTLLTTWDILLLSEHLGRACVAMEGWAEGTGGVRHVCQSREVDRRERLDKVPRSGSERALLAVPGSDRC